MGLAITAGVLSLVGFFFVVPGGALVHAAKDVYQWSDTTTFWLNIARWPVGLLLMYFSIAILFSVAPRRRQPGGAWLTAGAFMTVALWMLFSGGLAGVAVGSLATAGYAVLTSQAVVIPVVTLFLGIAVALLVGTVAGGYPAGRGSRTTTIGTRSPR